MRAPGLLRMVPGEARPVEQAFLQCGMPLGVTSRPGSRSALFRTPPTLASRAAHEPRWTVGLVVTMSLQIFLDLSPR